MFKTKRTLVFTQIADSRFCDDPKTEINNRIAALQTKFQSLNGIVFESENLKRCTFIDDDTIQYRVTFYVQKTNKKVIWNDVYKTVNSIKAVPYNFANMPVIA